MGSQQVIAPSDTYPYKNVFSSVTRTLQGICKDRSVLGTEINKYEQPPLTKIEADDEEIYWNLVKVIFYAGITAKTITDRLPILKKHFSSIAVVAGYTEEKIGEILDDEDMIRHEGRVRACVENATKMLELARAHGSVTKFLNNDGPYDKDTALCALVEKLQDISVRFKNASAYHLMMELQLDIVKPDRVMQRIFHRIGLTDNPNQKRSDQENQDFLWNFTLHARKFSAATGHSTRYIDISFMALGQKQITEFGVKGLCLENAPLCGQCQVQPYCQYRAVAINSQ